MRQLIPPILLLLAPLFTNAQEDSSAALAFRLDLLPSHHTTLAFGDRINVRTAPTRDAQLVGQLFAGEAVTILAADSNRMTVNGWTAHWHKIAFIRDNRSLEGFVWGGLLSPVGMQSEDICFVYNVVKSQTIRKKDPASGKGYLEFKQEIEIRALRHSEVLSSVRTMLPMEPAYRTSARLFPNLGLKPFRNVLKLEFSYPGGGAAYHLCCLWDGRQLLLLPVLTSFTGAGRVQEAESYLFPEDPGGQAGQVVYQYELSQDLDLSGENDYRRMRRLMVWNGKTYLKPRLEPRP
jgi:hypothetical protein